MIAAREPVYPGEVANEIIREMLGDDKADIYLAAFGVKPKPKPKKVEVKE